MPAFKKCKGSALLEACFLVLIMGILMGGLLPLLTGTLRHKREVDTQKNQENALRMLGYYVSVQGALPCPAGMDGRAPLSCERGRVAVGVLPYFDLGVSPTAAQDGYGHWMTYAVVPAATVPTHPPLQEDPPPSRWALFGGPRAKRYRGLEIETTDLAGNVRTHRPIEGDAAHRGGVIGVIISHGPFGAGAYDGKGNRRPLNPTHDAAKRHNAQNTPFFVEKPLSSTFDDKLTWFTQAGLCACYIPGG